MKRVLGVVVAMLMGFGPVAAAAQNADSDLAPPGGVEETYEQPAPVGDVEPVAPVATPAPALPAAPLPNDLSIDQAAIGDKRKMESRDVLTAAEGVFGKGAAGLAEIVQGILKDQGQPIGYIAGGEAGGAIVIGAKFGSGTLFHKVEGQREVFWRGPSIGFDAGADANKVFVLVYNLDDGEDLFKAYPAAEGKAYLIGGFTAAYLKRKDVVLIPVRLGAGVRLGANVGYMRFSKKKSWLPF